MFVAGPPKVTRELVRVFWRARMAGATVAAAGAAAGVSETCGLGWIAQSGGMIPDLGESSGRYLSLAERGQIAVGWQLGMTKAAIVRMIDRHPGTVGRELRPNRTVRYPKPAPRPDGLKHRPGARPGTNRGRDRPQHERLRYQSGTAHYKAEQRARRPEPGKLAANPELRAQVQARLGKRWSLNRSPCHCGGSSPSDRRCRCPPKPSIGPSTCKDAVNSAAS